MKLLIKEVKRDMFALEYPVKEYSDREQEVIDLLLEATNKLNEGRKYIVIPSDANVELKGLDKCLNG
jgi:hypothetical protein